MFGWDWLAALVLFELATGYTPGPNNLLAMAIGFSHGYRDALPHIFGAALGFPIMLLAVGFFLAPIVQSHPGAYRILQLLAVAFILYLAYRIATTDPRIEREALADAERGRAPVPFWQSVLLQWINPKAWPGAMSIATLYTVPEHYAGSLLAAAGVTVVMIFGAVSLWALAGRWMRRRLPGEGTVRLVNRSMAVLLVLSVLLMLR
ncbi:LysE family translocator [Nitratifractor sp.]